MKTNIPERIAALREAMKQHKIDAYIIPTSDPHMSEYPADCWKYREWISGFTGSAGTVIITADKAGLWTDSRYFLQASTQLEGTGIELFKMMLPETPTIPEFLTHELKEGQTHPPKHFTEDTLLHSMETASADSMPEDAERQGIGTPATRAATIEKLVQKGFLERKGDKKTKVLLPTDKGKALITVMPEEIQSADMTADWETKLLRVERGEMEPETFMTEINDMISSLVNTTEAVKGASALMKNKVIGVCPNCGNSVVEREKGYFCENRECRFVLWKDNAFFKRLGKRMDAHVADRLLRDGRVRLKDCKSSKGKTYNATVLLSTEADGRSKFSLEFEGGR